MIAAQSRVADPFERLRAAGKAAVAAGRLEEAEELLTRALGYAEEAGDAARIDLAFCNLSAVRIGRNDLRSLGDRAMNRLREILVRNLDATNGRLAAYNLCRAYELRKEHRKGLFYARLALDRSLLLDRQDWVSSCHNQVGNFLVAQSLFEEAAAEYRRALEGHPPEDEERRAIIEVNLAYCLIMQGDRRTAFGLLYRSLRTLRSCGSGRGQMYAHVDLCYAHLDAGRLRDALRHGERGLALAELLGEVDAIKNALFLLGQACYESGDPETARRHFRRLEEEFYPDTAGISEFLLAVDVRQMVNLRA